MKISAISKSIQFERGVTLVELIVTMTIMVIIAGMVAVFVQRPVQGYIDATHRADLVDEADNALRRIARDLRLALPNSVRLSTAGGVTYLEFLITSGGGRYRAAIDTTNPTASHVLDFSIADSAFDVLGPLPQMASGNFIVIYNLFSAATETTSNAYNGGTGTNRAAYLSNSGNVVSITPTQFPFASPSSSFQVVTGPVTYACDATTGTMYRYEGYSITLTQPTPPSVTPALLVGNVASCSFTYDNAASNTLLRTGLVSMNLQLAETGENVNLFQEVYIDNLP